MGRHKGSLNKATLKKLSDGAPGNLQPSVPGISKNFKVSLTPGLNTPAQYVTTVNAPEVSKQGQPGKFGVPDFNRTPENVKKIIGAGRTGTINYGGYFHEEYFLPLIGRNAALIYDEMRRSDYQVGGVLRHIYNKIKGADFYFESPDADDESFEPMIELLKEAIFNRLNKNWSENLQDVISFIPFGFSLFEPTWKEENLGPELGTAWIPKSLGYRSQKTIWKWIIVDDKLWSVQQISWGDDSVMVDIPGPDLLVFTLDKEGNNYEGISMLRQAYGPWFRKQMYLTMNGIGVERATVGFLDVEVPTELMGTPEMDQLDLALATYSTGQTPYLRRPAGFKLAFNKVDFDSNAVQTAIRMEDANIAKSVMTEFMELGFTGMGSKAVATPKIEEFTEGLKAVADLVCAGFNPLIKQIIDLNYGPQAKYPIMAYTGIDKRAGLDLAQQLLALFQAQAVDMDDSMKEWVRNTFGFPERSAYNPDAVDPTTGQPKQTNNAATPREVAQTQNDHGATIQKAIDDTKAGNAPSVNDVVNKMAQTIHTKKLGGPGSGPRKGEGSTARERYFNKSSKNAEGKIDHLSEFVPRGTKKKIKSLAEKQIYFSEIDPIFKKSINNYNSTIQDSMKKYVIPKYIADVKKAGIENIHGVSLQKQGKVTELAKEILKDVADKASKHAIKQVKQISKKKLDEGDIDDPDNYEDDNDDTAEKKSKNYVGLLYNGLLTVALSANAAGEDIEQSMTDYVDNANNIGGGQAIADVWADGKKVVFLNYENEQGVTGYAWVVHWLPSTCEECAVLDGETFDKYIDVPDRPVHANCNCDVEPIAEN